MAYNWKIFFFFFLNWIFSFLLHIFTKIYYLILQYFVFLKKSKKNKGGGILKWKIRLSKMKNSWKIYLTLFFISFFIYFLFFYFPKSITWFFCSVVARNETKFVFWKREIKYRMKMEKYVFTYIFFPWNIRVYKKNSKKKWRK